MVTQSLFRVVCGGVLNAPLSPHPPRIIS